MPSESQAPLLTVVIPAFNEAAGIGPTLDGLRNALPAAEIVVVDDCSADRTAAIAAERSGVIVLRHSYNRGQGASLKTGMRRARGLFVAWFDADNEHRAEDLARLWRRAAEERLVAVIGQRTTRSASLLRGVGKGLIRVLGWGLKVNAGNDLNCGLRVFRRTVILRYLPLVPDRFSASLVTTLVMLERRYPVAFEPVTTNPRIGTSTVRVRDGIEAMLVLVRAVLLFAPLRIFLPGGLALLGLGTAYSLVVALAHGLGVPVAGMLLVLAGLLFCMLGLIADQISQLRLAQLSDSALVDDARDEGR